KTLVIKDLHVSIDGNEILKGINLTINGGEFHAIMGPNGTGKSTLASAIMGHPAFEITQGSVHLNGEDVLEMEVDERARAGLFLGMQYPSEVTDVTTSEFLRTSVNSGREEGDEIPLMKFIREMDGAMNDLEMDPNMSQRYLNEGFSGGEKKRNEILQMMMIKPDFAILDEIDSGLDITNYQRLLNYMEADHGHVIMQGRIVKSGGPELAKRLEGEGYEWVKEELGIEDETVGQKA